MPVRLALAASFFNRVLTTRLSLLLSWPGSTHRSSTSATEIADQSKSVWLRCSYKGPGELPPDTIKLALPRACIASCNAFTHSFCKASKSASRVSNKCSVTIRFSSLQQFIDNKPAALIACQKLLGG